jgi:hydrogenase maturation protease
MVGDKALVVCVGNSLVGDDAAGCAVFESLAREPLPEGARVCLLGTGGISLLEMLAGESILIVVDAVQFGAKPGTVQILDWSELPPEHAQAVSAHGIGVRQAIDLGRTLYPGTFPRKLLLVGIEGMVFDTVGASLTPEVACAVEEAARAVRRQLELLLQK